MSASTERVTLVVQAHPDDTDISSGASVARWCRDGEKVVYVTCTSGEAGKSEPPLSPAELGNLREREERAAAGVLGVAEVLFLRHPDGLLVHSPELESELADLVLRFQPTRLVTHDPTSEHEHHPDHLNTGKAALAAVIAAEKAGHRVGEILLYRTSEPNTAVDVTETLDLKLAAMEHHRTQRSMGEAPPDAMRAWATSAGERWGFPVAETFRALTFDECVELVRGL
ncbi:MAG: PIG-L deacetylase family protein [Dehalococcoidia bacterium]